MIIAFFQNVMIPRNLNPSSNICKVKLLLNQKSMIIEMPKNNNEIINEDIDILTNGFINLKNANNIKLK